MPPCRTIPIVHRPASPESAPYDRQPTPNRLIASRRPTIQRQPPHMTYQLQTYTAAPNSPAARATARICPPCAYNSTTNAASHATSSNTSHTTVTTSLPHNLTSPMFPMVQGQFHLNGAARHPPRECYDNLFLFMQAPRTETPDQSTLPRGRPTRHPTPTSHNAHRRHKPSPESRRHIDPRLVRPTISSTLSGMSPPRLSPAASSLAARTQRISPMLQRRLSLAHGGTWTHITRHKPRSVLTSARASLTQGEAWLSSALRIRCIGWSRLTMI